MLHTKFHQRQPSGSWQRRFLKCFYHIWAWQPSWSCDQHYVDEFSFPCPYKLTFKFWLKMAQWLLIKQVQVSCVTDLGPRSKNDLDLQYSHIFIKSISLRSQAAIVSEKSTFFTFSYRKAKVTKFDLVVK